MKILIMILSIVCVIGCQFSPECIVLDEDVVSKVWLETRDIDPCLDSIQWNENEYWQTYEETADLQTGDCEDYCIYFLYRLYEECGYKGSMVGIYAGEYARHAIVEINGMYIEPQIYMYFYDVEELDIRNVYQYDELMFTAKYIRSIEE